MIVKSLTRYAVIILILITGQIAIAQNTKKSETMKTQPLTLSGFKHGDVGNPSIPGAVSITKTGIDIKAGGEDVWGTKDEFNFVYIQKTGDFDFVSRIESLTPANLYTKAGLMAREDLSADSRHIFFQVFADNNSRNNNNGGYEFQYRQAKGAEMKAIYPPTFTGKPEFPVAYPNTWIRLRRINNDFTGYYSTDGKTWKAFTTYTLALPSKLYLGLALTSHNVSHTASAKFRNISELKH
jgi:regulation of enolase protein 1 (concanavalin A-like superfamily)